ncbi:SDR family oxidoreductase [Vreelandella titanicae]|jgi:NAD(P)-dependent dehydrogenase (short-subunit alcohol dehydrogenase family)|uniref:SDR family NAD(P)-dependent oxidoreductase n=1 Tax=Vreelandella titanicae TaxID=664683 RepID=UPI000347782E|nr:SDR family oxidoreductase [Halomonas titanicae]MCE7517838.1 SDR family oxidoreductase [Halomonas titanicae]NVE89183.1 SDR family oxidoreductase [Halomonas titanicae]UEQ04172.1 SDR family oxidoreductase [Halomonas profundus]SDI56850.1 NAD(P)-dependent dehydrogenase, short-chain alcohol dehydrogenase family [Halomonas titanicae]|tara:strand:+ start:1105 stop:1848 length:744 start_codon:yes stop_codon:yes gene_type:complete
MGQPSDQNNYSQPLYALVTGGARNIGQAISLRLQQDGYRVIVVDIVEPEAASLQADAYQVDLADADATRQMMVDIAKRYTVTRLINNVGIVAPALLEEATLEDFDKLMQLNVRSALICTQAMLPAMKAQGAGRIVMNASRVVLGKEARTIYSATKGALQSMARTWALELAEHGITVNCVAPGPIATSAFWQNNPPDSERARRIIDNIPLGRMGQPEDVAQAVSFFCDERSSFITGQTLFVCGGVTVG